MKTSDPSGKISEFDPRNRLPLRTESGPCQIFTSKPVPNVSMYTQRPLRYFAVAVLLCVLGIDVQAETLCVATPAELRVALQSAEDSAAATEIRVRKGFYSLPAVGAFADSLVYRGESDLKMTGGWENSSCTSQSKDGREDTVLSADGLGTLFFAYLKADAATEFHVERLSFRQGYDAANISPGGACLSIQAEIRSNAIIRVDSNSFRLCRKDATFHGLGGSALAISARDADVYVRGNLMVDNVSAGPTIDLSGTGFSTFFVSNNTVAYNAQLNFGVTPSGMLIRGTASDLFWLTNNVLWKNGTTRNDFAIDTDEITGAATPVVMRTNLMGTMAPLPSGVATFGNLLGIDPRFNSSNDLRPSTTSLMRDGGSVPPGGSLLTDFENNARVWGPAIDLGAYEFTKIFSDSFE